MCSFLMFALVFFVVSLFVEGSIYFVNFTFVPLIMCRFSLLLVTMRFNVLWHFLVAIAWFNLIWYLPYVPLALVTLEFLVVPHLPER